MTDQEWNDVLKRFDRTKREKKLTECNHPMPDLYYYPSINNAGWKCVNCQTELGERPDLDQKLTIFKIRGLMQDLCDAKIIYISNGSEGDFFMRHVERKCQNEFTQDRIILEIIKEYREIRIAMKEELKRIKNLNQKEKQTYTLHGHGGQAT